MKSLKIGVLVLVFLLACVSPPTSLETPLGEEQEGGTLFLLATAVGAPESLRRAFCENEAVPSYLQWYGEHDKSGHVLDITGEVETCTVNPSDYAAKVQSLAK